jgi:FixJ family two-component response regulator
MNSGSLVVAIVDDDPQVVKALRRLVRALGHDAEGFGTANALLYGAGFMSPTHVLIDLHMPDVGGPALTRRVHERWPDALILVMSGLETDGAADTCRAAGASLVLRKPLRVEDLESFFEKKSVSLN